MECSAMGLEVNEILSDYCPTKMLKSSLSLVQYNDIPYKSFNIMLLRLGITTRVCAIT